MEDDPLDDVSTDIVPNCESSSSSSDSSCSAESHGKVRKSGVLQSLGPPEDITLGLHRFMWHVMLPLDQSLS